MSKLSFRKYLEDIIFKIPFKSISHNTWSPLPLPF